MENEVFKTIMRAIIDEHHDVKALDKIVYACEQQTAHIQQEEMENSY